MVHVLYVSSLFVPSGRASWQGPFLLSSLLCLAFKLQSSESNRNSYRATFGESPILPRFVPDIPIALGITARCAWTDTGGRLTESRSKQAPGRPPEMGPGWKTRFLTRFEKRPVQHLSKRHRLETGLERRARTR